jgi:hypothetical protein
LSEGHSLVQGRSSFSSPGIEQLSEGHSSVQGRSSSPSNHARSPLSVAAVTTRSSVVADGTPTRGHQPAESRIDAAYRPPGTSCCRPRTEDDIRPIVERRRASANAPAIEELLPESEVTKQLWSQWHRREVHDGVLCRLYEDRLRDTVYYQAIIPYTLREATFRSCHAGMTGGHLGVRRTLDQILRHFYWMTWRSDTLRCCRRCVKCNSYHRGQLPRSG